MNCHACEDEGTVICSRCNGSGEGMADGSTCPTCKGSGEITCECKVVGAPTSKEDWL